MGHMGNPYPTLPNPFNLGYFWVNPLVTHLNYLLPFYDPCPFKIDRYRLVNGYGWIFPPLVSNYGKHVNSSTRTYVFYLIHWFK
jgi:hypothetical protein